MLFTSLAALAALLLAWILGLLIALGGAVIAAGLLVVPAIAAIAWTWTKATAVAVVVVILFGQLLDPFVPAASSLDEAGVALVVAIVAAKYVLLGGGYKSYPGGLWFVAFAVAGITGAVLQDVDPALAGQDLFLLMKGPLLGWAIAQMPWTTDDIPPIVRVAKGVAGVAGAGIVANILVPGWWFATFSLTGVAGSRGGLITLVGPFSHPQFLSQGGALAATAILAYGISMRPAGNAWKWAFAAAAVITLETLRRKAIIGMLAACAAVLASVRRTRAATGFAGVVFGAIIVAVLWDTLGTVVSDTYSQYIAGADSSPRSILYTEAVGLASSHFPLGAGLGRYGTYTAFANYSPVYYELGFNRIWGLGPDGEFATDTFWPAILGEAGWVGVVAFVGALVRQLQSARRLLRIGGPDARVLQFVGLVAVGWWVEFAVESIAAPIYTAPPLYPLLFAALGVAVALGRGPNTEGR